MPLKRTGFFRESHHDDSLPSLRDAVRDTPQAHEAEAVAYLRSGLLLVASPGIAFDVLSPTRQVAGTQDLLTDGVWSWPADFPYYVEAYHCVLPDEFVEHMRARNWRPPAALT